MKKNLFQEKLHDMSSWTLLGSNIIAIVMALWQKWELETIMLAYWSQSIIIGIFCVLKILSLENFSTKGVKINDMPVQANKKTKRTLAMFFCVHFGIFHIVYLVFILGRSKICVDIRPVLYVAAIFFANHLFSFIYNKNQDRKKKPNIGNVVFFPYLRIIPMHFTIIFGSMFFSQFSLVLFLGLKTIADLLTHALEHTIQKE